MNDHANNCLPEFCTAIGIAVVIDLLQLTWWPMRLAQFASKVHVEHALLA